MLAKIKPHAKHLAWYKVMNRLLLRAVPHPLVRALCL
jgi:hypothetical protein